MSRAAAVSRDGGSAPRAGRPCYSRMLEAGGKDFLAAVVSLPGGRWDSELGREGVPEALLSAAGLRSLPGQSISQDSAQLVGFAVLQGWRFMSGSAPSAHAYALVQIHKRHWRRRVCGPVYLEHQVLASCCLLQSVDIQPRWLWLRPDEVVQELLSAPALAGALVRSGDGGPVVELHSLLSDWRRSFSVELKQCVLWAVAPMLAIALSSGRSPADVACMSRDRPSPAASIAALPSSVAPSRGLVKFMRQLKAVVLPPLAVHCPAACAATYDKRIGSVTPFTVGHCLRALRLSLLCRSDGSLQEAAEAAGDYNHPGRWQTELKESSKVDDMPHSSTLGRLAIRVDIAAMLQHRYWYASSRPAYRYLAFDASPQHGTELFGTVERIVLESDLKAHYHGATQLDVYARKLPICQLGQCRLGAAEKAQTLLHQIYLEYGPSPAAVILANYDVRACLTDMGTEMSIVDMANISAACLPSAKPLLRPAAAGDVEWLFPNALGIPGLQHVSDLCLRTGVENLPWWPSWQSDAKVIAQWLKPTGKRLDLEDRLAGVEQSADQLLQRRKSLSTGVNGFAEWRWHTLDTVLEQLLKKEDAIVAAVSLVKTAADFGKGGSDIAVKFLLAVRSPVFWHRAQLLRRLTKPLTTFGSWLRGCDCHEHERKAAAARGKAQVVCIWAGCRGKSLKGRVAEQMAQLLQLRADLMLLADTHSRDAADAVSRIASLFDLKTSWVSDLQFSIWALAEPADAADWLSRYDSAEPGRVLHRVAQRFGCVGGEFRLAMDQWAAGNGMTQELAVELLSYQLVKVDDTWQEAVHAQVSQYCRTAAASRIPRVAARQRLQQNLKLAKSFPAGPYSLRRFLRSWKAIDQADPKKAWELRHPRWTKSAAVLARVYRCGSTCMTDWSRLLRGQLFNDTVETLASPTTIAKMQVEHIRAALDTATVFSTPAAAGGDDEPRFFQVVDAHVDRKKLRRDTEWSVFMRRAALPVSVQWLSRRAEDGPEHAGAAVEVVFSGTPIMVDMLDSFSWDAFLSMQVWDVGKQPQPGVMSLENGRPVPVCADWKDPAIPVMKVLQLLADAQWKRTTAPVDHTPTGTRVFHVVDPLGRKAYLRCLLGWDTLVAAGLMVLPAKGLATYYQCVLAASDPAAVPIGCSGVDYLRLLHGEVAAADLHHRVMDALPLALGDRSDEEDEPCLLPLKRARSKRVRVPVGSAADWGTMVLGMEAHPMPVTDAASVAGIQVREWMRGSDGQSAVVESTDDGLMQLVTHEPVPPAAQPAAAATQTKKARARGGRAGRAESPPDHVGGASSSAAAAHVGAVQTVKAGAARSRRGRQVKTEAAEGVGSASAAVPVAPGGSAADGGQPLKKKHRTANDPDHVARIEALGHIVLEGVSVSLETKIDFRLLITCPCKEHSNHKKTRRFDMGSGCSAELGDAEAYAFLGAWLQAGPFMSKAHHAAYRPTPLDVLEYAKNHEWQSSSGVWHVKSTV